MRDLALIILALIIPVSKIPMVQNQQRTMKQTTAFVVTRTQVHHGD